MRELFKICPDCSGKLRYKRAQFVDYLVCESCNNKFTESKFRNGVMTFDQTELFHIVSYYQNEKPAKTIIYFSGANTKGGNQAKRTLGKSRIFKLADAYNLNIICIGIKKQFYDDFSNYRPLINFLFDKYKLTQDEVILCGFSNGGIPAILCGSQFKFHKIWFISPVLSALTKNFCEQVQSDIVISFNIRDIAFINNNYSLVTLLMKAKNRKFKVLKVDAVHSDNKAFEKLIEECFDQKVD